MLNGLLLDRIGQLRRLPSGTVLHGGGKGLVLVLEGPLAEDIV